MTVVPTSSLPSLPFDQPPWATPGTTLSADPPALSAALLPVAHQLDELATLPPGWNSYNARPIDPRSREAALSVLAFLAWDGPLPTVSPTPRGGVQLEWGGDEDGVELEFAPDGVAAILIQVNGEPVEYPQGTVTDYALREAAAWASKLA